MLVWGLAQLAGAVVLLWQPALPHAGVFLLSIPVVLAVLGLARWRWLAAFWLGALLASGVAGQRLEDRLAPELDGEVFEITGRIVGLVEDDGRRQRIRFRIESGTLDGGSVVLPRIARLNIYDPLDIATGERWRWRVKLRRARGLANPGTFDYERWLFASGIGATGYVRDVRQAERLEAASGEWRAAVATRMAAVVEGPAAGLLRGLATGDRDGVTAEQWELLRLTGTVHLMAISGLHIALVSGMVLALAAFVRRRWRPSAALFWPPLAAGCAALVYGALAGFGLPVQRALVAGSVLLLALALRRHVAAGHVFGGVLVAVLCLDPLAPLDVGFWLSFGAVAAILFTLAARRPADSRISQALRVQLGLFLLMAPLVHASFGRIPLLSPLANLVAIPVFDGFVVPCVLLAMLLLPWPAAAAALLTVPAWVLERLLEFLEVLVAADPGLALRAVPLWVLCLAAAGFALAYAPRAWPGRSLGPWLLLPWAWLLFWNPPGGPPLAVHFLDVGQGLAVVVETPSRTLVYDTGPGFGSSDAAKFVVIPFLEARGRTPDIVMISHGDNDHAGGLESMAKRFPGARLLGSMPGRAGVAHCSDEAWWWGDVSFRILHPPQHAARGDNDASCVLRIEHGAFSMLLTGDIEAAAEARLVRKDASMLAADVALLPHHGSRTSSTPQFVRAVHPSIAIAGAGHGNRWGFPKADVVRRWESVGAKVSSTGEQGAISVVARGETFCIYSFRHRRRIWRDPPPEPDPPCQPVR